MDSSFGRGIGQAFETLMWIAGAGIVLSFLMGCYFVYQFFAGDDMSDIQRQAIDRGYALHCPATGAWAWKGECGE